MFFKPAETRRRSCFAAFLIAVVFFLLHQARMMDFHELRAVDLRFLLRGAESAHPEIVIVEIDGLTLEGLGTWPWPRAYQAEVLSVLESYSPRLIFWGVLLRGAPSDPSSDTALALTMEKSANVILPFLTDGGHYSEAFFPPRIFLDSSRGYGFSDFVADADGHIRRVQRSLESPNRLLNQASVQTLLSLFRDEEQARRRLERIPLNSRGEFWISFPGSLESFRRISLWRLMEAHRKDPEALKGLLKGRVLMIGGTIPEITSMRPAAFSMETPAIVLQAAALHTLLSQHYLREVDPGTHLAILVMLCLTLGLSAAWMRPRRMLFVALGLILGYWIVTILLFNKYGWILPFIVPPVAIMTTYVTLLFLGYLDVLFQGELMARELSMAARVQATFLPHGKPELKDLDFAFECRFAKDIGGDFYDWMDLGNGIFGCAVGDVSGKGIPAAIYMVRAISELRRENHPGRRPSELLAALNRILADQTYTQMFLTLSYGLIDPTQKSLIMSLAGYESFLYYNSQTRKAEIMKVTQGPPLGVFVDSEYPEVHLTYEQGDVLIMVSDGVTELRDSRRNPFGMEPVRQFLQENAPYKDASELVGGVMALMEDHRGRMPPHDDRTILCVKFGSRF